MTYNYLCSAYWFHECWLGRHGLIQMYNWNCGRFLESRVFVETNELSSRICLWVNINLVNNVLRSAGTKEVVITTIYRLAENTSSHIKEKS